MDISMVDQLSRQWHSWVAKYGRDKRWRHLSVKPTSRWDFPLHRQVRPHKDDMVDRSGVQAWWHVERTDTNRSRAWPKRQASLKEEKLTVRFWVSWRRLARSGSNGMMDTPVPIPNTEVKHHRGEDSTLCENSALPVLFFILCRSCPACGRFFSAKKKSDSSESFFLFVCRAWH